MFGFVKKAFGSSNERQVKKIRPLVEHINSLESKLEKFSDEKLVGKTAEFRQKLDNGASLEDILPSAFAVVREAGKRVLGMRHYDVQMVGGVVLNEGRIAEMKTGEGKTLVATLPLYLNGLTGRGAHLVTVNDYLARRDAEWMGQLYNFLGLSYGVITNERDDSERREAYGADITYGTNNEFGFDYLRDHMKFSVDRRVHKFLNKSGKPQSDEEIAASVAGHESATSDEAIAARVAASHSGATDKYINYCIVDEVDSILIDEARTPLIISGPADKSSDWYYRINAVIPFLKREQDFLVDEKGHSATLTDSGVDKVEARLKIGNLYEVENIEILHHVHQALKAHTLYKKGGQYVVESGEVIIVDEFTGRKMQGRRWSDGLHQAIEAKEGVRIEEENETLATITFQNYFRLYDRLSGMTGTADTEAPEFHEIYSLDVVVIPTNKPIIRQDRNDLIYKTEEEKWRAVARDIVDAQGKGQPVLVGTTSVEKSEYLSTVLHRENIPHNVLNAKYHEMEANIVAQAGQHGAVTIATNMAGRGTDIVLGGNPSFLASQAANAEEGPDYERWLTHYIEDCKTTKQQVLDSGGLHIIGTERHESRRIDNQLRGRAGRQGDPGSSRFYLCLDDDLMRIFGSDRIKKVMETLRMPDDEPIEHKWINKAVENAQKKIEARNFDIRKNILKYDDVMNLQRKTIYDLRDRLLIHHEGHILVREAVEEVVYKFCDTFLPEDAHAEDWDEEGLTEALKNHFACSVNLRGVERLDFKAYKELATEQILAFYEERVEGIKASLARATEAQGDELTPEVAAERWLFFEQERYLGSIDKLWKHHLKVMEALKEGIHLEAYGQKNPEIEYKKQGFDLFGQMIEKVYENVTETLFRAQGPSEDDIADIRRKRIEEEQQIIMGHQHGAQDGGAKGSVVHRGGTYTRNAAKVGRNDPCPCGSGKKFKKCHDGNLDELDAILSGAMKRPTV
jgi:preprotein translocase subunit SecA